MRLFWAKNEALIPGLLRDTLEKPGFVPYSPEIAWVIPVEASPGYPGVYPTPVPSLIVVLQMLKIVSGSKNSILFPEYLFLGNPFWLLLSYTRYWLN